MDVNENNSINEMLKNTLRHLDYDQEDIDAVFKDFKGKMSLQQAVDLLNKQKRKKLYGFEDDLSNQYSCQMIVISSDSESDDEKNRKQHQNLNTKVNSQLPNSDNNPIFVNSFSDDDDDLSKGEILGFAYRDLPDESLLCDWFKQTYVPKNGALVLKEDMFKEFCKHFIVPSYKELENIFFKKVDKILSATFVYKDVHCIENACFDGIEKVEQQNSNTISQTVQALLQSKSTKLPSTQSATFKSKSPVKKEKLPIMAAKFPSQEVNFSSLSSQIQKTFSSPQSSKVSCLPQQSSTSTTVKKKKKENIYSNNDKPPPSLQFSQSASPKTHKIKSTYKNKPTSYTNTSCDLSKRKANQLKQVHDTTKMNVNKLNNLQLLQFHQNLGPPGLRPIVIDGSNVACEHGNGMKYSCRGIALCVRFFWIRGHREITCFVPNFRKGPTGNPPPLGQEVLFELEKLNICKFTPSRRVNGKNIVCYDDRFILDLADQTDGVVVSNDQFRDLMSVNKKWKNVIEKRLLPYVFVKDIFMPATDPLGQGGPDLDEFLKLTDFSSSKCNENALHGHSETSLEPSFAGVRNLAQELSCMSLSNQNSSFLQPKQTDFPQSSYQFQSKENLTFYEGMYDNFAQPHKRNRNQQMKEQLINLFPEKEQDIDKLLLLNPGVTDIQILANELFR